MTPFETELLGALPKVRAFARRLVINRDKAEDLVQEACVKALAKQSSYKPDTNMFAWLCTILKNHHLSEMRKSYRSVTMSNEMIELQPQRILAGDTLSARVDLTRALEAMPYVLRDGGEMLGLIAIHGLRYDEAAAAKKMPIGSIKSHVSRDRAAIREHFA